MVSVLRGYDANPSLLPPFDDRLAGYVSAADRSSVALPESVAALPEGTHEIIVDGREIHVAIVPFEGSRLYRVYNFDAYEKRFKRVINALTAGTGIFALLTIWLAYGLSGLLVRQVAGLARQVKALRHQESATINPGRYDEAELVELVEAFNDFRLRMAGMIAREKEFTGNVSHELRTPLTAIKTSCELLAADPAIGEKSRARLTQIEFAADRMRDTVNALLLLAREESSAFTHPVALAGITRAALQPFADALKAKCIEAVVEVDASLFVDVNEAALTIVLANLIDNAVRHTSHGTVHVAWSHGRLLIEDTGSGIAPEALPHVFDRFYSAGAQASDGAQGFGIGLAIVRKLCERYGWTIAVESEPGRGTRVSLGLPLAAEAKASPSLTKISQART
jgi:signal transduction histidine kinase